MDMGHRVKNQSPVKISSDKDSLICVTDSDSDVVITSEVDGKAVKADGGSVSSEASVSTNGGIYISNSAKENEKGDSANNLKEKKQENEQENDESDGESGVYFSDSEEFERVMKLSKLKQKKELEDGASVMSGSSEGFYFSDKEEFERAKKQAKLRPKEELEDGASVASGSSGGVYFSDFEEFQRAMQNAKLKEKDSQKKPEKSAIEVKPEKTDGQQVNEKAKDESEESVREYSETSDGVFFSDDEQFNQLKQFIDARENTENSGRVGSVSVSVSKQ